MYQITFLPFERNVGCYRQTYPCPLFPFFYSSLSSFVGRLLVELRRVVVITMIEFGHVCEPAAHVQLGNLDNLEVEINAMEKQLGITTIQMKRGVFFNSLNKKN